MRHVLLGIVMVVGLNQASAALADPPRSKEVVAALDQEFPIKDFQQPMNFKDGLGLIYEKLAAKGKDIPIFIDKNAFMTENPKASNVYDSEINLVDIPPHTKLSLATILRLMLGQVETNNATYLIRRNFIEITTKESARVQSLLQRTVSGVFDQVKLRDALTKLSDKTGASIILDPRVEEQAKTPITATLRNDITLEGALAIITDMADLQFVVLPSGIYVTTEQRAKKLEKRMNDRNTHDPGLGANPF